MHQCFQPALLKINCVYEHTAIQRQLGADPRFGFIAAFTFAFKSLRPFSQVWTHAPHSRPKSEIRSYLDPSLFILSRSLVAHFFDLCEHPRSHTAWRSRGANCFIFAPRVLLFSHAAVPGTALTHAPEGRCLS
jgi:hypothetical protein